MRLAEVLVFSCLLPGTLGGQGTSGVDKEKPRRSVALGVGILTGMAHVGDQGKGPVAGATLRIPHGSRMHWLVGAAYGIVFTPGWTSPEGVNYSYAPEGVIGSLGAEWLDHPGSSIAVDLQWNPTIGRVRRWGPDPGYPRESTSWDRALGAGSLGGRVALPFERGPIVSITARAYMDLAPGMILMGVIRYWMSAGISIQPR